MASTLPLTIKPTHDGVSKIINARILETSFGDGYRQRLGDGINVLRREYSLSWQGSNTNIEELITHFEERAGYKAFTINDADIADDVTYKWTCVNWNYGHLSDTTMTLSATLQLENDL